MAYRKAALASSLFKWREAAASVCTHSSIVLMALMVLMGTGLFL